MDTDEVVATSEDRRFVWMPDLDGKETPIMIGKVVDVINQNLVPGFRALSEKELSEAEIMVRDMEHHHRYEMMHSPTADVNWRSEAGIINRISAFRTRIGLVAKHLENPECCSYLVKKQLIGERVGI